MKPILFNTEMVRAILDGRKTVTRRAIKNIPPAPYSEVEDGKLFMTDESGDWHPAEKFSCYQPDDILYVRETWGDYATYTNPDGADYYMYRADYPDGAATTTHPDGTVFELPAWKPSIHMPREAARIFLRVTDVRAERLWDIDEEQARAEGTQPFMLSCDPEDTPENKRVLHEVLPALPRFPELWDSTIKPADRDKYGWDANPWVWVIEFEMVKKEEVGL